MKNFKIISVVFSVMALLFFVSCDTEDTNKTDSDSSIELNDIDATSVQKRDSEGESVYKSVPYNEGNKKEVLEELLAGFMQYLYVDLGFDSQEEVVFIEVEKHIEKQQYLLKYEFTRTVDIAFGLALGGISFEMLSDKEQLELLCSGGAKDGTSITVDRPTGAFSAVKFAKAIEDFANACLDGGGCIEVCKVEAIISALIPVFDNDDKIAK